jgi:hypothetical protein
MRCGEPEEEEAYGDSFETPFCCQISSQLDPVLRTTEQSDCEVFAAGIFA